MTQSTEKPTAKKKAGWGGAGRSQGRKPITGMIPSDGEPYDILSDPVACSIVDGIRRFLGGKGDHREEMEVHSSEYNRRSLPSEDKRSYDLLVENRGAYNLAKRQLEESLRAYRQQIFTTLSVSTNEWNEMSATERQNKVVACLGLTSKLAAKWNRIQEQQSELKKFINVGLLLATKKSFYFAAPRSHGKRLAKAFETVSAESFQSFQVHLTKTQVADIWTRWHKAEREFSFDK